MHAIEMDEAGGPEVLRWRETAEPAPGPGDVLIDVVAAGVNRADLLQRQGFYDPPPGATRIMGLECAGIVAEVGAEVSGFSKGDRVCALLSGGGYAERVAAPAEQVLPAPDGLDLAAAAALPEVAATVWSNLVMTAGLRAGQLVLLHGGGSGIGTHAIQVARRLGATVAVTAGSDEKLRRCAELGATVLINYREQDFVEVVRGRGGADVILDNMGAAYLGRNVAALAPHGHLVVIGMQGGVRGELDLGVLLRKWGSVHATNLRGRPTDGPDGKGAIVAQVREHVWALVADGTVAPIVHAEVPIAQAAEAHRLLDSSEAFGKVVLRVRD